MLPEALHKFFWEYDPGVLDMEHNWFQVIERLLEYGDLEANRWGWMFKLKTSNPVCS